MQLPQTNHQPTSNPSEASSKKSTEAITQDTMQPAVESNVMEKTAADVDGSHATDVDVTNVTPLDKAPKASRRQKMVDMLKWFLKDQWFLIAMGIIILISSQVQVPDAQQRVKRTIITYLSVSVIFFCNGCMLDTKILIENYMRWKLHVFVQLQCYLVTSAATFAIVSLAATNPDFMDPWLLIGFLFIGTAPTTMSSNVVMTRQAHGNPALTVVQSTIGQLLCPFLTPILLQMYLSSGAWYSKVLGNEDDNYGEIYKRVFKQLGLSLFIPMAIGQIVKNLFPGPCKQVFVDWKLSKLPSFALLTLIWQTFDQAFRSGAFKSVKPTNIVFIIFISTALYMIWLGICFSTSIIWLPRKDTIACCYCCPAKALAMVVSVSSVMFINLSPIEQSKMQIPAIIYQALQVAIGGVLTISFRKWIRPFEEKEDSETGGATKQDSTPTVSK